MDTLQTQQAPLLTVTRNGQKFGPFSKETLLENVKLGNFTFDDLVWHSQLPTWEPLRYHVTQEDLTRAGIPLGQFQQAAGAKNTLHGRAATAISQTFGFHPTAATLTVLVDLIIFGGTVVSIGLAYPILVFISLLLGVITFMIQQNWYQDNSSDAMIKALIVVALTAIPLPIATALMAYYGITGKLRGQK